METGALRIRVPLIIDVYSVRFLISVLLISASVLTFSYSYIRKEKFFTRFHLLVFAFIFSIVLLIFRPNLISLLIGWDGLGVTSYLLVIYFYSHKSLNAGLLTALTNRLGDCLFLISIALLVRGVSINMLLYSGFKESSFSLLAAAIILVAASTKRAQLPFSAWLPAAIAAPTPVSSLVHSSTLVTAGVYVLFRISKLLSTFSISLVILIGCLTITLARLAALTEIDMKKIVALSTLRQLGLMITIIGIGSSVLSYFHLLSHAYFKALLFIRVGNLIHLSSRIQDLRMLFSGNNNLSLTPRVAILANLRLIGTPFIAGFYSKDQILEFSVGHSLASFFLFLLILSVALTAAYRVRFLVLVTWDSTNKLPISLIDDNDNKIFEAIIILVPFATIGGSMLRWVIISSPEIPIIDNTIKFSVISGIIGGRVWGACSPQHKLSGLLWSWALGAIWALPFFSRKTSSSFLAVSSVLYAKIDLKLIIYLIISLFSKLIKIFLINSKTFIYFNKILFIVVLLLLLIIIY